MRLEKIEELLQKGKTNENTHKRIETYKHTTSNSTKSYVKKNHENY
jgi:hypothetical protein